MKQNVVEDIRTELKRKLVSGEYVTDKSGVKMIEIVGCAFLADEPTVFGAVNEDYVKRELDWYLSMSLNVNDIPPPVPAIWKAVATPDGRINSNYGWAVFSEENGDQYLNVFSELSARPESRRGQMIYTRPSMHSDFSHDGMSDFMCCSNTVHHIRDGALHTSVYFRSNDGVYGYRNDYAWMKYVHDRLALDLKVTPGPIYWHAASFHIYERHFELVK